MLFPADNREAIAAALKAFGSEPIAVASRGLFASLGYKSDRCISINTAQDFLTLFDSQGTLSTRERDALGETKSLNFLFQLTSSEIGSHGDMFDDSEAVSKTKIESYLFFAIDLAPRRHARAELSTLVRAVNKPLAMPALVLFRHGDAVSLGIIHRRLHRRDQARDVLEKVTLVKDIAVADPIRAHLEILNDFVFANLDAEFGVSNFVRLHEGWQKRLSSYALSNEFYREIADWYFWAHHQVEDGSIRLPRHCDTEQERALFLIRLLTRVIFCWFLVEKRLIPADLFHERRIRELLVEFAGHGKSKSDDASTYYHAILQNLFFGTLNMPADQRGFRARKKGGERFDPNYGITNLWRYESYFRAADDWVALSSRIPFLNGGLFDCLDDKVGSTTDNTILDGFSDNANLSCHLPNDVFFGPERTVDLSRDYGEEGKRGARSRKARVRGLIEILSRYKFTIEENTPLEEEIALDPELLGKVFENLLASYNEDTRTTARKALGAFYTPREVVAYMVDEALKLYLVSQVPRCRGALDDLFSNKASLRDIRADTRDAIVAAIGRVRILDPACGSGAFPMGALHRLVDLLQKLDPNNESWKRDRLAEARRYRALLEEAGAAAEEIAACDARISDIEKSFDTRFHALDFARKLYIIESCIFGVDALPVAVQIAKLRFFISLVVDQKIDVHAKDLGVRPLPNLETRLVAADTLVPVEKDEGNLFSVGVDRLRADLAGIRHEHFNARSPAAKRKWRDADEAKRSEIAALLEDSHSLTHAGARTLAGWDPYDQNAAAPFFDSEWMFGLPVGRTRATGALGDPRLGVGPATDSVDQTERPSPDPQQVESGFDVVIGNPPYVLIQDGMRDEQRLQKFKEAYEVASYKIDLYHLFIERGIRLLKEGGTLAYITPSNFATNNYCAALRAFLFRNTQLRQFLTFDDNVFHASVNNWVFLLSRGRPGAGKVNFVKGAITDGILSLEQIATLEQSALERGQGLLVPPTGGNAGPVLDSLLAGRRKLDELATVNFGMQLRDRKAFPTDVVEGSERLTKYHRPCFTGRDIRRFVVTYGGLHCYFNREAKRGGCWDERVHSASNKILIRQIGEYPEGGLDLHGYAVLNTAFMILPRQSPDAGRISRFLLAVLNSTCVRFFWRNSFRDDRKTFPKIKGEYLKLIPIPDATEAQTQVMATVVDLVIAVAGQFQSDPTAQGTRGPLMMAYWERILNGLIFELYFPAEVHNAGLTVFDLVTQASLPAIESAGETDRMARIRHAFEKLYDGDHPLRVALDKLQTLDTIRVVEGEA